LDTIELAQGGILLFDQAFLKAGAADRYFAQLRDTVAWEQKPGIFGHMQPRLIASHGDAGVTYRYSGSDYQALPWTTTLLEIKEMIEAVQGDYNYCLLNRYRSGSDSMGWHADDEPEMGNVIGSLSLGATRTFRIRHNVTREIRAFPLSHGTLLIMAGTMQHYWKHEIPKTRQNVGERINLTFRKILKV
jgi:alkylated DNA repair dioxygenase AlkB